jgi:hypothetical protein
MSLVLCATQPHPQTTARRAGVLDGWGAAVPGCLGRCQAALDASFACDGRGTKGALKLTLPLSTSAYCQH